MAKRKSKGRKGRKSSGRRTTHHKRRRHHGGGGHGVSVPRMIASAALGFAESAAAKDATNLLNKIPRPIDALGYTGGTAAALYLANMFFPHPWLKAALAATSDIAAYQMGRAGGLLKASAAPLAISGPGHGHEHVLDDDDLGELEDEHVGTLATDGGGAVEG